ncbi:WG repeat-containing protein [Salmonella enterica]|nr:WG repeat-containing protein [Salmonella enterica subsp. enterica serovar Panama]HCM4742666.1 WG repeat-containing protein [Salmonella enterica subsp. enterica serovar Panama]
MKRNTIISVATLLLFIVYNSVSIASNNDKYHSSREDISNKSISEVRDRLDQEITELEQSLSMIEKMKSIHIGSGEKSVNDLSEDDEEYTTPIELLKKDEVDKRIDDELIRKMSFRQYINTSSSLIKVRLTNLEKILSGARLKDYYEAPHLEIKKIVFIDGSEMKATDFLTSPNLVNSSDELKKNDDKDGFIIYGGSVTLPVNKPVAKINIELTYQACPGFTKKILNRNNAQFLPGNSERYQLTSIEGNTASLMITAPKDTEYAVEGANHEGKTLYIRGSSTSSFPSDRETELLRTYLKQLVEVRDNIDSYPDTHSLQTYLKSLRPVLTDVPVTDISIRFKGNPDSVVIYRTEKPKKRTISTELVNQDAGQVLFIAEDSKTKLYGFIDKSGEWQIKPQFEDIQFTDINGLYEIDSGGIYKYYLVDQMSSRYFEAPFENVSQFIENSLLLVQKETNGSYGVYDIKKHKFVIPMAYVNVKIKDNLLIASLGKQTYNFKRQYGVLTLQGEEIVPFKFESIDYENGYLYAVSSANEQRDIYDVQGKKMNPDNYQTSGVYYKDQPVVLKSTTTGEYSLLNIKGEVLPVKLPYDEVLSFSNGMAIVEKNNLKGAIDVSGKLKIPLEYDDIESFQENLAAAVPANSMRKFVLIDRNNKVIKQYAGYSAMTIPVNSNNAVYHVYDDNLREFVIDADGNIEE